MLTYVSLLLSYSTNPLAAKIPVPPILIVTVIVSPALTVVGPLNDAVEAASTFGKNVKHNITIEIAILMLLFFSF